MGEKGNLSINSENILPIIKKWLYSDTDIFVRELVSNASDAINKLKKLVELGDVTHISTDEEYEINIVVDKENKLITISDNGIGMTADEIKQYINEIAFSGATDFIEKYKDKMDENNEIIGHFGLGFYSAFMVAEKVQIDTLSFKEGASPARWICEGGIDYEMMEGEKESRGTTISLFVGEDGMDFLEEFRLKTVLKKYCSFLPVSIYFEAVKEEEEIVEGEDNADDNIIEGDIPKTPINNVAPLWIKKPSDCTDEDYKSFYNEVFSDFNEPLFWIHLNMDYPFKLKGILYFPKLKHELEANEGQVKLFSNQVFIADNIKEVIPEFLLLLKGTLDCPEIPLNVSRSFLQNDGYVTKMSSYITKKVADKLNSLFKKDRETYNKYWDDIHTFIKYGCIREKSFYDKVKDSLLFKNIYGEHLSIEEYKEKNKEKSGDTIYYVSNEQQQAQYIKMFKDNEMDAAVFVHNIDNPFMSYIENYAGGSVKFARIDSDLSEALKDTETEADEEMTNSLSELFKDKLSNDKLEVKVEALKSQETTAVILLSEQERRMQEMTKMFGGGMMGMGLGDATTTLVLNQNNNLVKTLLTLKDDTSKSEDVTLICEQIYDIAMMSHKPLGVEAMNKFVARSNELLGKLAGI